MELLAPNAYAVVLSEGNPIILSNEQSGTTLEADPDAVVCWTGADPSFELAMSWKNLLGSRGAFGESYMFQWTGNQRASVLIQPKERNSGINLGMDGGDSGRRPSRQTWGR